MHYRDNALAQQYSSTATGATYYLPATLTHTPPPPLPIPTCRRTHRCCYGVCCIPSAASSLPAPSLHVPPSTTQMLTWGVSDPYCRFIPPSELAAMKKYDVTGVGLNLGTAEEFVRKTGRQLPR